MGDADQEDIRIAEKQAIEKKAAERRDGDKRNFRGMKQSENQAVGGSRKPCILQQSAPALKKYSSSSASCTKPQEIDRKVLAAVGV